MSGLAFWNASITARIRSCLESPPHQDILRVTVSPGASPGFSPSVWAAAVVFSAPAAVVGSAVFPEPDPVDYEADLLEPIRRARLAGRTHFMIIVAEGVEGGAYSIGKVIEEATALDTRVTVLGHIQRGGSPSSRDRITATYMGYEAVRLLAEGKTCRVVALQGENYVDYDITEALQMTKSLDQHTYEVMRALTGVH